MLGSLILCLKDMRIMMFQLSGFYHNPPQTLPLVSREWKNGSNSSCNCTPFLRSLLTKGKKP